MLHEISLAVFATVLVGCGAHSSHAVTRRPLKDFGVVKSARVDLLARQLLVRSEAPPPGYAYYCYLLFADRSGDRAHSRRLAASAYLGLLSNVLAVKDLKEVQPEDMALLVSPIKTRDAAEALLKEPDVEVFLATYDYDRAQVLFNRLRRTGREVPAVSIVGSRAPIESMDSIDTRAVFVVSLEDSAEGRAESVLLRLQNDFEAGIQELRHKGEPLVLRAMRKFFGLLGDSLEDLKKIPVDL